MNNWKKATPFMFFVIIAVIFAALMLTDGSTYDIASAIVQTSSSTEPAVLMHANFTPHYTYDYTNGTANLTWTSAGYKYLYIKDRNPFSLKTIRFYTSNLTGVNVGFDVYVSNDNVTWYHEPAYNATFTSSNSSDIQSLYLDPSVTYNQNNLINLSFYADVNNSIIIQVLKEK